MDLRAMKIEHLKKAYRRAKRKHVTLWKTFGIIFLVLTLVLAPLCLAVVVVDNALVSWVGGTTWELVNQDGNAQYFRADRLNAPELTHQAALEGITLLKNENAALPLQAGASIGVFGADNLKTALESRGFVLNEDSDTAVAVWDGNTEILQALADRKKAGSLKKLIILLPGENVACLKDNAYQADAALWIGASGTENALAEILSGKVSPSGSLPKTLSFDTASVAYPFGYGLSYTDFAYSDFAVTCDESTGKLTATLTVTNTGAVSGKKTVQIYSQAPDTDTVTLAGFGKTEMLAPGAAETITISVNRQDLTAGYLTAATDADNAANNILSADPALTYVLEQEPKTRSASAEIKSQTVRYNPGDYPVTPMPTLGAENGLKLFDMIGIPYEDAKWQTLLDQLTFLDMVRLLTDNYALQKPIESVQAPGTKIETVTEMGLPSGDILAATFSPQLIGDAALAVGNTCLTEGVGILRGEQKQAYSEDVFLADTIFTAQTAGFREKGVQMVVSVTAPRFVQDAILAGQSLSGEWFPVTAWELYQFENDPVIVSAMREACHGNLYALANSSAMNGIGEATTVKTCLPWFTLTCWIAAPVCLAAYIFFAIMWHLGKKKWKKTQEYLDYKTMQNTLREEKKQAKQAKKVTVKPQNDQTES